MLLELGVVEQRYRAVLEVLDGVAVTDVARRYGVSRQTVHAWLRRYAEDGDSTAMSHLGDHVAQRCRTAGHLEADIEPLPHVEFALCVNHVFAVDVHRSGDTKLAG